MKYNDTMNIMILWILQNDKRAIINTKINNQISRKQKYMIMWVLVGENSGNNNNKYKIT